MDNIENAVARARAISQVADDMLYDIKYAESEVRNISEDTDDRERDRILDAYERAQVYREILEWMLK